MLKHNDLMGVEEAARDLAPVARTRIELVGPQTRRLAQLVALGCAVEDGDELALATASSGNPERQVRGEVRALVAAALKRVDGAP